MNNNPPNHRRIAAIDPGATGAIALLDRVTGQLQVWDMPLAEIDIGNGRHARQKKATSALGVASILSDAAPDVVWIEDVGARPGQGVVSMFTFGRAVGTLEGVCAGLAIPVQHVRPQIWMREFGVVGKGYKTDGSTKTPNGRKIAAEAYPEYAAMFDRVKDHGRADAALIALYGAKFARGLVTSKYAGERTNDPTITRANKK